MMIKLPAPETVIDKISQVLHDPDRTKTLDDWVQHRLATREPASCSKFVKLLRWARKLKRGSLCMPAPSSTAQPSISTPASQPTNMVVEAEKMP